MSQKTKSSKFMFFTIAIMLVVCLMPLQVVAVDTEFNNVEQQSGSSAIISPLWNNVDKSTIDLSFSSKKINSYVSLKGVVGTKYKNGTVTIYKYSGGKYVQVKSWTNLSSSSSIFLFSNSELSAISGVKYKLTISITAYTSTKSEVISLSKVATCP